MKLIVGLGNPGKKYENTRHNIGFLFADYFAGRNKIKFKTEGKGKTGRGEINSEKIMILKPETFMNLSGEAVQPVAAYNKIQNNDILIVHDDVDLPMLEVRIKKGGGYGGHNGLKSIIEMLGDNSFIRVRVGIGRPDMSSWSGSLRSEWSGTERTENPNMDTADWVLSKIPSEQKEVLNKKFEIIEKFVLNWVEYGYEKAASKFKDE